MNVFSRVKRAVVGLFGGNLKRNSELPSVTEKRDGKLSFQAPPRLIRYRVSNRPVMGPAFDVPRENHHLSRETCRHYLRSRFFASVSQGNPLMSRQDRRRMARLFAKLEYRRMMTDPTNAIDAEMESLLHRKAELEAA